LKKTKNTKTCQVSEELIVSDANHFLFVLCRETKRY